MEVEIHLHHWREGGEGGLVENTSSLAVLEQIEVLENIIIEPKMKCQRHYLQIGDNEA